MEKIILAPGIYAYKNVFNDTKELIGRIEEAFKGHYGLGGVYEGDKDSNYSVNTSSRNVDTFAMSDPQIYNYTEEQKSLYESIKLPMIQCLNDYKADFSIGEPLTDDCWMILRYGKEQKFDNHADDGSRYPRLVSMTAYLNNDYEGGELEYKNFGLSFKPDPGDVLIFPSNYVYQHRVVPVTSGLRYAVVNWFRWATIPKDTLLGDVSGVQY
jgi:predicted 2-oxoglutarate/Fe(II)-dependent dioxygenase YbiX